MASYIREPCGCVFTDHGRQEVICTAHLELARIAADERADGLDTVADLDR